jgi:hypothetical protein
MPAPCKSLQWGTVTKNWKSIIHIAVATGLSNSRSCLKSALPCDASERKITGCSKVLFIFVPVMNVGNSSKGVRNTENRLRGMMVWSVASHSQGYCSHSRKSSCQVVLCPVTYVIRHMRRENPSSLAQCDLYLKGTWFESLPSRQQFWAVSWFFLFLQANAGIVPQAMTVSFQSPPN